MSELLEQVLGRLGGTSSAEWSGGSSSKGIAALVEEGGLDVEVSGEAGISAAASLVREAGVAVLRGGAPEVESLRAAVEPVVRRTVAALDARGDSPREADPDNFAFLEACGRGKERVDVKVAAVPPEACERAAVRVARAVLGEEAVVKARGAVASFAGADAQRWHRDGEPLFENWTELPAHAVTILMPLLDVDPTHGPTQFLVGSHAARADEPRFVEPVAAPAAEPLPRLGDAIIFDYRLIHRGGRHTNPAPRLLYYLVVAKPWFADVGNFPERGLSLFEEERGPSVSRDDDDPDFFCVATHPDEALDDRLEATVPKSLKFGELTGPDAARALARRERFAYVDSICFLRDRDLRDRHLLAFPPHPTARALGIDRDLRAGTTLALEVAPAPGAGLGVFALEPVEPRRLVAEYTGLVEPASADARYALEYAQTLAGDHLCLSALRYGNVARFVNHDADRRNADLLTCDLDGLARVVVVANTHIAPGDQILVDYGPNYWRRLGIRPLPLALRVRDHSSRDDSSRDDSSRDPPRRHTLVHPKPPRSPVSPKTSPTGISLRDAHTRAKSAFLRFLAPPDDDSDASPDDDSSNDTHRDALAAWHELENF